MRRLIRWAKAVADGDPLELHEQDSPDAREARLLDQFRVIADIAKAHRTLGGHQSASLPDAEPPPRTWAHLELRHSIGRGSFGEVYEAWDTRLERLVALKLFPHDADPPHAGTKEETAIDEGRLLARVRHPHVVAVYGADRVDGRVGIWMELIHGRTLEAIVTAHGPLSAPEAILVGLDVCRALAAVHQAGLLHRDLNARNVMREHGGRLVLMDLGAGRLREPRGATNDGIGTPLYLAPEIFEGADASVRSDLYSLGVLLFYLVTGTTPAHGATAQDVIDRHRAGRRTSLREARPDLPDDFIEAVQWALAPDAAARPASAAALAERLQRVSVKEEGAASTVTRHPRHRRWLAAAALVAAGVAAGLAAHALWSRRAASDEVRLVVSLPRVSVDSVAASPDGRHLAITGVDPSGTSRLWLRPLGAFDARPMAGTDGASNAFWSGDGRALGFFAEGKLVVISASGGAPRVLCDAPNGRGGAWNRAGVIVFAPTTNGPLMRIAADGGTPTPLTSLDRAAGEISHRWPALLADGSRVLYASLSRRSSQSGTFVVPVDGGPPRRLSDIASNVVAASGRLLFARGSALLAQPLDADSLRPLDEPRPLANDLTYYPDRRLGLFTWSPAGLLAYGAGDPLMTELTAYDRAGQPQFTRNVPGAVRSFALSHDGARVLLERLDPDVGTNDIWTLDLASERLSRLTFDAANDTDPVWSPDGRDVLFSSDRELSADDSGGTYHLFRRSADAGGREELVSRSEGAKFAEDWSADGRMLFVGGEEGARQIFLTTTSAPERARLLVGAPFFVDEPSFSPDGRFVAYHSTESGQAEVFVTTVADPSTRWQVSRGGLQPRWRDDGGELYYLSLDGHVMAVAIASQTPWRVAAPRRLVRAGATHSLLLNDYAARRDGELFLVRREIGGIVSRLNVVLHWRP